VVNKKQRPFDPTEQPGPARVNMTVEELHDMLERFKKLFEDSSLAKYVKLAGIGGLVVAVIEFVRAAIDLYKHFK
jgi:hypothetical protein